MTWADQWQGVGAVVAIVAALLVGGGVVVRFSYRTAVLFSKIDAALPTLLGVAAEFKNNGGNTLRDRIDKIDAEQERLRRIVEKAAP